MCFFFSFSRSFCLIKRYECGEELLVCARGMTISGRAPLNKMTMFAFCCCPSACMLNRLPFVVFIRFKYRMRAAAVIEFHLPFHCFSATMGRERDARCHEFMISPPTMIGLCRRKARLHNWHS